ncbi:MAG: hypothetical protein GXP31_07970, partial [Kiritimatiellaeota bacterium]|nr:hypothetical protein [Kiritimatiellota bacterium]
LLAKELTKLYRIEVLALTVMSNHYHIVCAAPAAQEEEKIGADGKKTGKQIPDWRPAVPGKADAGGEFGGALCSAGTTGKEGTAAGARPRHYGNDATDIAAGARPHHHGKDATGIAVGARPHHYGDDVGEIKRRWRAYYGDKRVEPN